MIDFNKIIEIINSHQKIILTTHINPDGDAIGSEIALALFLLKLNKSVRIINVSSTPAYLEFLNTNKLITKYNQSLDTELGNADLLIALDFNQPDRLKYMKKAFTESKATKICIDHHRNPKEFVKYLFVDSNYNATGEIIYQLIKHFDYNLFDRQIADAIYSAIMTDTGSFRFERMRPEIHIIASELLKMGTNATQIYNKIYNEVSYSKLILLGKVISEIKFLDQHNIAYMTITQKMLEDFNATEEDVDGFVNFTLSLKEILIGLLFLELKDGVKVSLRSKNQIPINTLAEYFNGGGHLNAAGIRFYNISLNDAINTLIEKSKEFIKEYVNNGKI